MGLPPAEARALYEDASAALSTEPLPSPAAAAALAAQDRRQPSGAVSYVATADEASAFPTTPDEPDPMDVARTRQPQQQQAAVTSGGGGGGGGTVVFIPFAGSLHGVKRATIASALITSPYPVRIGYDVDAIVRCAALSSTLSSHTRPCFLLPSPGPA